MRFIFCGAIISTNTNPETLVKHRFQDFFLSRQTLVRRTLATKLPWFQGNLRKVICLRNDSCPRYLQPSSKTLAKLPKNGNNSNYFEILIQSKEINSLQIIQL